MLKLIWLVLWFIYTLTVGELLKNKKEIPSKFMDYLQHVFLLSQQAILLTMLILNDDPWKQIICGLFLYRLVFMVSIMPGICRYKVPVLSLPITNRTLSGVCEILLVKIYFGDSILIYWCIVAEVVSYFGMITRNCYYFLLENSIWTIGCIYYSILNFDTAYPLKMVTLGCYLYYMVTVNLPMYYTYGKQSKYGECLSVWSGFLKSCKSMTQTQITSSEWKGETGWQCMQFVGFPIFITFVKL